MGKRVSEQGGKLDSTTNIKRLRELAYKSNANNDDDYEVDEVLCNMNIASVELVHYIRTEDEVKCAADVSDELKRFSENSAKEWLETVVDPFCKNVCDFMEKHPEFTLKSMNFENILTSGESMARREMQKMLSDLLK